LDRCIPGPAYGVAYLPQISLHAALDPVLPRNEGEREWTPGTSAVTSGKELGGVSLKPDISFA
jgi:hypothetical protein